MSVTSHPCIRNSHRVLSQLGKQARRATWSKIFVISKLGERCEKKWAALGAILTKSMLVAVSVESQSSENGQLRVHPRDYRNSLTTSGPVRPCSPSNDEMASASAAPRAPIPSGANKTFNDKVCSRYSIYAKCFVNVIQGKPMEVRLSNLVAAKGVVSRFKLAEIIS